MVSLKKSVVLNSWYDGWYKHRFSLGYKCGGYSPLLFFWISGDTIFILGELVRQYFNIKWYTLLREVGRISPTTLKLKSEAKSTVKCGYLRRISEACSIILFSKGLKLLLITAEKCIWSNRCCCSRGSRSKYSRIACNTQRFTFAQLINHLRLANLRSCENVITK